MKTLFKKIWRWAQAHPGGAVALGAVLLVGGRVLWVQGAHWLSGCDRTAMAYGSAAVVYQAVEANPDGSKIAYFQTTQSGMGLFVHDLATGVRQVVYEEDGRLSWAYRVVWPWSPGGNYFAFSRSDELNILSGTNAKPVAILRVKKSMTAPSTSVVAVDWLTDTALVCWSADLSRHVIRRDAGGVWRRSTLPADTERPFSPRCLSADTIGWMTGTNLWQESVRGGGKKLVQGAAFRQPFDCVKGEEHFLVNLRGKNERPLWEFKRNRLGETTWQRLPAAPLAEDCAWLGRGSGYAYYAPKPGGAQQRALYVHARPAAPPVRLFANGKLDAFSVTGDGRKIFAVGSVSNEAVSGIWSYEVESGRLTNVVTALPDEFTEPKIETGSFKTAAGRVVNYRLLLPADWDAKSGRRHPLLIYSNNERPLGKFREARGVYPSSQALAKLGALVASVERPGESGDRAAEDMLAMLEHLRGHAAIDTNQVYLSGNSAETYMVSKLVEEHPGLWAGAMFLSPGRLPDLAQMSRTESWPKMLLAYPDGDDSIKWGKKFQAEALRQGAEVTVVVVPQSGHSPLAIVARQSLFRDMARFVFF